MIYIPEMQEIDNTSVAGAIAVPAQSTDGVIFILF